MRAMSVILALLLAGIGYSSQETKLLIDHGSLHIRYQSSSQSQEVANWLIHLKERVGVVSPDHHLLLDVSDEGASAFSVRVSISEAESRRPRWYSFDTFRLERRFFVTDLESRLQEYKRHLFEVDAVAIKFQELKRELLSFRQAYWSNGNDAAQMFVIELLNEVERFGEVPYRRFFWAGFDPLWVQQVRWAQRARDFMWDLTNRYEVFRLTNHTPEKPIRVLSNGMGILDYELEIDPQGMLAAPLRMAVRSVLELNSGYLRDSYSRLGRVRISHGYSPSPGYDMSSGVMDSVFVIEFLDFEQANLGYRTSVQKGHVRVEIKYHDTYFAPRVVEKTAYHQLVRNLYSLPSLIRAELQCQRYFFKGRP